MAGRIHIPPSACSGIAWPALPPAAQATVLALMDQLDESQWLAPDTLRSLQWRQIEALLGHAAATVPFYRDRLAVLAGVRRGRLTEEAWRKIPPFSRDDMAAAGDSLLSRAPPENHAPLTEGGRAGLKKTAVTGLFQDGLDLRDHLWHRRDLSARVGSLTRLGEAEAGQVGKAVPWPPVYGTGRLVSFDSEEPVADQVAWLERERPAYLLTRPSVLAALVHNCGGGIPGLVQVSTTGETLDDGLRAACREAWGIDAVDVYRAREVGIVALQCPDHPHLHVQSENLLVEVLSEAGDPCGPGETGRVVVTDLHNFATPLIRSDIGDDAEVGGACPCGRRLAVLTRVRRREDDTDG